MRTSPEISARPLRRVRRSGWKVEVLAILVLIVLSGCTTLRQIAHGPEQGPSPEAELRAAAAALEAGDFSSARDRLAPLTAGCLNLPVERRAALLRASAEIDPTNPDGVPTTAATLAARVIVHAPAGDPDAALARSIYTMALDRGASVPAEPYDMACEAPPIGATGALPTATEPSTASRLSTLSDSLTVLNDSLSARNDSIAALQARATAAEERARTLEHELERIRQLLRGGLAPRP